MNSPGNLPSFSVLINYMSSFCFLYAVQMYVRSFIGKPFRCLNSTVSQFIICANGVFAALTVKLITFVPFDTSSGKVQTHIRQVKKGGAAMGRHTCSSGSKITRDLHPQPHLKQRTETEAPIQNRKPHSEQKAFKTESPIQNRN